MVERAEAMDTGAIAAARVVPHRRAALAAASRADVARFMLTQVDDTRYVQRSVLISQ